MKSETKIRIGRNSLLAALLKVARVASSRRPLILFEVKDGTLTVKASNYETQIEATVNINGEPSGTAFCMDGSITGILKLLPEQPLAITVTEEKEGKTARISVGIAHSSGTAEFPAFAAGEYTEIKCGEGETFSIPAEKLKRGLEKTAKFADKNELKPALMSVHLDITRDGITFAGTDQQTLSVFKDRSLTGIDARSLMIGADAVNSITALLDKPGSGMAVISSGEKVITVAFGDTVISTRAIEGRYPNYSAVIPANNPVRCTVDSGCLSAAVNRISIASDPALGGIGIAVSDGEVRLSGGCPGLGTQAVEEMPARCEGGIEVKTCVKYLKAAMGVITGNAVLSFSDPVRPILISPEINEDDTELLVLVVTAVQ
ncbi:MAG: DNA polymerase III subunit beta [Tannerella sp.]|jgi:DNA polymerase-3 subunit beta|nr:DNA polymerase III subunit beta [Tannerella sp.]